MDPPIALRPIAEFQKYLAVTGECCDLDILLEFVALSPLQRELVAIGERIHQECRIPLEYHVAHNNLEENGVDFSFGSPVNSWRGYSGEGIVRIEQRAYPRNDTPWISYLRALRQTEDLSGWGWAGPFLQTLHVMDYDPDDYNHQIISGFDLKLRSRRDDERESKFRDVCHDNVLLDLSFAYSTEREIMIRRLKEIHSLANRMRV